MYKYMTIEFSNGERWKVPTEIIAESYAKYYSAEFDGNLAIANWILHNYPEKMIEWAEWKMNWSDFNGHQIKLEPEPVNYQDEFKLAKKGFSY